jgi:hypothetical protein
MRIKLDEVREGIHPSEAISTIKTITGPEELVVNARTGRSGFIDVGNPVGRHEGYYLVELPSETSSGAWRVWIDKDIVLDEAMEAAE